MTWVNDRPLRFGRVKTRRFVGFINSVYGNHINVPALYAVASRADINTGGIPQMGPAFVPRSVLIAAVSQGKLLNFIAELVCDEFSEGIHEEVWDLLDLETAQRVHSIIMRHDPSFQRKAWLPNGFSYELNGQVEQGFQRIVNEYSFFQDPTDFRYRLADCEAKVVRIDIDNRGHGTGFLVGPDLILTNYHVIAPAIDNLGSLSILCDHKYVPTGEGRLLSSGRRVALIENGLIARSQPDSTDIEFSENGTQNSTLLDFALLRLSEPIGRQGLGENGQGEEQRGWYKLSAISYDFETQEGLLVLGHPQLQGDTEAGALKLSLSLPSAAELTSGTTRVRYGVNTEDGHSGSPVLNQHFQPVALHHAGRAGQPEWASDNQWNEGFNQGVPVSLIVEEIRNQINDASILNNLGL